MDYRDLAARVVAGTASQIEMSTLGLDRVLAVKRNGEVVHHRVKAKKPIAVNEDTRTISYVISDETVDRMGDIIKVKGWDLTHYKQNPVILWGHDNATPPIGRATNVRRRYGPARLTADVEFAPKDAHEFADTIYQLAKGGFLKATSVGFMGTTTEVPDEKQREKLGMGPWGVIFTASELMETSIVSVPANPNALETGMKSLVKSGAVNDREAARFFDTYPMSEDLALGKIRAACRSFVDFGAGKAAAADPVVAEEDPVEEPIPVEDPPAETEVEEKGADVAADDDGEGGEESEPVGKTAPEPPSGWIQLGTQASVDAGVCYPYTVTTLDAVSTDTPLVEAMAKLIEQQAEQAKATRQLVDALSDLTNRIHVSPPGGARGGSTLEREPEPEADAPDAEGLSVAELEESMEKAVRGFAERLRREVRKPKAPTGAPKAPTGKPNTKAD